MNIFEWWNDPPTQPPYQSGQVNFSIPYLTADGGRLFGVGDVESAQITGDYDVTYNLFSVPPKSVAVFIVNLRMYHTIYEEGYIEVDYASGNFEVMCPALVIGILTRAWVSLNFKYPHSSTHHAKSNTAGG